MSIISPQTTYQVDELRSQEFPLADECTYLNHAGISPLPLSTKKAVSEALQRMGHNPAPFFREDIPDLLHDFGSQVAHFINAADPLAIVPVSSTSTALNLVSNAIDWHAGDQIMLCEGEFPSNVYPWMQLRRLGVDVSMVEPQHGTLTVQRLADHITDRTRLVTVSALQFFTGARTDLMALGKFCNKRGILFAVDAIQAIGHMPIDVQAMHIDILATGGQKSIMGLTGSGFLYVRRELADTLQPTSVASNATADYRHWINYTMRPREGALRFLQGTTNTIGMLSVLNSMNLIERLSRTAIDIHTTALIDRFIADLQALDLQIVTPLESAHHGPIVTFNVSDDLQTSQNVLDYLIDNNVAIVQHLDVNGRPHLRVSVHCYNNDDDRQRFIELLAGFIKGNDL